MRFSWFGLFPFSGTEISFQIYWRFRGWSFSCRSKISSYSIQATVNCLCREDFWFDSRQFEERIISAVELMHSGDCSHLVRCDVRKSISNMSTMMNFFLIIFYSPFPVLDVNALSELQFQCAWKNVFNIMVWNSIPCTLVFLFSDTVE